MRSAIARELKGGLPGAEKCGGIVAVFLQHVLKFGKGAIVVLGAVEHFGHAEMERGIFRKRGQDADQLGLGLLQRAFLQEELDQFEASLAAVGVRIELPHSINCIVIEAQGVVKIVFSNRQPR